MLILIFILPEFLKFRSKTRSIPNLNPNPPFHPPFNIRSLASNVTSSTEAPTPLILCSFNFIFMISLDHLEKLKICLKNQFFYDEIKGMKKAL